MKEKIQQAILILKALGYPKAQQNDRSGLCLLGLLNLTPDKKWKDCESPLIGITPLMEFARNNYAVEYKPNTRETFRRQTIHQFVAGGLALRNPDDLSRPVNSPKTVYQIEQNALELIKSYGQEQLWKEKLEEYLYMKETLADRYAKRREKHMVPVELKNGEKLLLTPGEHSELIRDIIEEFASRFAPGSILIYVGDTGSKIGYFDKDLLAKLGVTINKHGKMPDVVLYYQEKTGSFSLSL